MHCIKTQNRELKALLKKSLYGDMTKDDMVDSLFYLGNDGVSPQVLTEIERAKMKRVLKEEGVL